jgi:tRNA A-37 threonylcarbamoyl transferase component Bud32
MVSVCPNNEELLAVASGEQPSAELRSHLESCGRCARKILELKSEVGEIRKVFESTEREAIKSPVPVQRAASKPPEQTAPTNTIGKYVIVAELGSGGQASVYRAVHPTLDQQVVIKLSSRKLDDSAEAKNDRLISEGRILCQLRHANIGRILDLDFYQHRPFLVMEYVQGRSLDVYARSQRLTPQQIATIMAKVARAVDLGHRLGIVHQDIKPQNILIDQSDEPKVLDFGMARLNGAWDSEESQPLGGTIQFMAPEQARGETAKITALSDVFAMGAVLYFLLTDKAPFGGPIREENLRRAQKCEIDLGALEHAEAPAKLKQIALKAMSSEPAQRYRSAAEMADALEALVRPPQRRRAVLVGAACVVVVAGLAAVFWRQPATPIPPDGQLLVTPDGVGSLDGNLPLLTGEGLKIEGEVPRDLPAVVFWVGAKGQVFHRPAEQYHTSDVFDRVVSPGEAQKTSLTGPEGTEFILMVAGRDLGDAQKVQALQSQLEDFFGGHPLAELPATGAVTIGPGGVQTRFLDGGQRPRDPGAEDPDSCAAISQPLQQLVQQLKADNYFFAGIAVPHQDRHD